MDGMDECARCGQIYEVSGATRGRHECDPEMVKRRRLMERHMQRFENAVRGGVKSKQN